MGQGYPDVAAIVETIASKKAKEQQLHLEERMKQIDEMQSAATRDKAEAELLNIHPDFEQIRDDDAFHDWAEEQPKWCSRHCTRMKLTPSLLLVQSISTRLTWDLPNR